MNYTVQQLAAQVKAWEDYIAILCLLLFVGYWLVLSRESSRRRLGMPAPAAPRHIQSGYPTETEKATPVTRRSQAPPCWEARHCPIEMREGCPGYLLRPLPCWAARSLVAGRAWAPCANCPLFSQSVDWLVEAATRGREVQPDR